MKKLTLVIIALVATLNTNTVFANASSVKSIATPSPTYKQVVKKVKFNNACFGTTQNPHYSSHVPGTINVIAETDCLGKQVSVQTFLFLGALELKHNFIKNGFTSHRDRAVLSTSWPCNKGHTYIITAVSYHVDDRGHGAETVNRATVYCGKIPAQKPVSSNKLKK